MCWPCEVTASGGERLRTICSPAVVMLNPLTAASTTPTTRIAPMTRATIAGFAERPFRGELAIQVLRRERGAEPGRARRRWTNVGRNPPAESRGGRRHDTRHVGVARPRPPPRGVPGRGSWDDAPDGSSDGFRADGGQPRGG